jgi:hypothetical protein
LKIFDNPGFFRYNINKNIICTGGESMKNENIPNENKKSIKGITIELKCDAGESMAELEKIKNLLQDIYDLKVKIAKTKV